MKRSLFFFVIGWLMALSLAANVTHLNSTRSPNNDFSVEDDDSFLTIDVLLAASGVDAQNMV